MNLIQPAANARVRKSTGHTLYRVAYARPTDALEVSANLQTWTGRHTTDGRMAVTHADEHGIEVRLPRVTQGVYRLEIRDGEQIIRQPLLLQ